VDLSRILSSISSFFALRKICHGWLVIGSANKDYYLAHGMKEETIFPMPYTVDNQYFRE